MHPNFLKNMRFGFNEVHVMLCLFGGLSVLFELFHDDIINLQIFSN